MADQRWQPPVAPVDETRGRMSDFGRWVVAVMIAHKDALREAERIGAHGDEAARDGLSAQTIALAGLVHSLEPMVRRKGLYVFDPSVPEGESTTPAEAPAAGAPRRRKGEVAS